MRVAIETAIALLGLFLAHSLVRQQRIRIATERIGAYRRLWAAMAVARPSRLDASDGAGPMTRVEGRELYDRMTAWYYEGGAGMLLPAATQRMYVEAKRRLSASLGAVDWDATSPRRMRELSLLRTQMKSDVAIYGPFEPDDLTPPDEEFLRACGFAPGAWARPWWRRAPQLPS